MIVIWDFKLVILSVITAMYGSFVALSHAERMRKAVRSAANAWMISGALTFGLTIWCMHFIGMLAFHLPVPIAYDLSLTVLSIIPAICAALLGFYLLKRPEIHLGQLTIGGLIMGAGISAMHYIGMYALKMQPAVTYSPLQFMASLLIAFAASVGAMLIVYKKETSGINAIAKHFIGAAIMGVAIAGMHYTGMAAANFAPDSICTSKGGVVEPTLLSIITSSTVFIMFTGGWIASLIDKSLEAKSVSALNQITQQAHELEIDRNILEKINSGKSSSLVLNELAKQIEKLHPEMLCTILKIDDDGETLKLLAAPSLPDAYKQEVDFLKIADGISPCGTAAYTGKLVIVDDVEHSDWKSYQPMARRYAIRACWAQPIIDYENHVQGTFAVYHRKPALPNASERLLIDRYAYLAQLILKREEHENKLHHVAFHDGLTGLPNRSLLNDRLQQAIHTAERIGSYGALVYIDLDRFKSLNDTKGHHVGDQVLVEMANRIISNARKTDTVARLGGDEFVIVLNDLDPNNSDAVVKVELICKKIQHAINQTIILKDYEFQLSASIGVSLFNGQEKSVSTILKHADTAMYHSKNSGGNQLHFFDRKMQDVIDQRLSLQNDLREALNNHEMILHYQLQVDIHNQIVGVEALVRWLHPIRGQVSPYHFIPIAEETGVILDIGDFVLKTACQQLKDWEVDEKTKHLIISINVSVYQLMQPDFVAKVVSVVNQTKANPKRLKIELTESMVMKDLDNIIIKMKELQTIGVRFSMDDFGTGYSSLASLKNIPISQLKIDKSFVDDITNNKSDATIVKTIIAMGNTLGLNVIAEGVENEEQLKMLREYDCNQFQGYLISKPIPIEQLQALLSSWEQ